MPSATAVPRGILAIRPPGSPGKIDRGRDFRSAFSGWFGWYAVPELGSALPNYGTGAVNSIGINIQSAYTSGAEFLL